jgi:hypothetical protein
MNVRFFVCFDENQGEKRLAFSVFFRIRQKIARSKYEIMLVRLPLIYMFSSESGTGSRSSHLAELGCGSRSRFFGTRENLFIKNCYLRVYVFLIPAKDSQAKEKLPAQQRTLLT